MNSAQIKIIEYIENYISKLETKKQLESFLNYLNLLGIFPSHILPVLFLNMHSKDIKIDSVKFEKLINTKKVKKLMEDTYLKEIIMSLREFINEPYEVQIPEKAKSLTIGETNLCKEYEKDLALFTRSKSMITVLNNAKYFSKFKANILILGEQGTGKELIANAIHEFSKRKGEFIMTNCSGIPSDLFESQMFGHKKNSFTGAFTDHDGYFLKANDGTLFLDEIGEMPIMQQPKLLRAVENRKIWLIGDKKEQFVDVRCIFATNKSISSNEDKFRSDLYTRIAKLKIIIPPLRERISDIPFLSIFLFNKCIKEENLKVDIQLKPEYFEHLQKREWPGNIRELENYIYNIAIEFVRDTQSIPRLKKIISGNDGIDNISVSDDSSSNNASILIDKDIELLTIFVEKDCKNIKRIARDIGEARKTTIKKINSICVRLLSNFKNIDDVIKFLQSERILENDYQCNCFTNVLEKNIINLKNITDKNSLQTMLYKSDIELLSAINI